MDLFSIVKFFELYIWYLHCSWNLCIKISIHVNKKEQRLIYTHHVDLLRCTGADDYDVMLIPNVFVNNFFENVTCILCYELWK